MTCNNCKFGCKSVDNETCERFKNAEFYDNQNETLMTQLDRVLKLLEEYDSLVAVAFTHYCIGQDCRKMLTYLRSKKEKLRQELIEHGCRRKN